MADLLRKDLFSEDFLARIEAEDLEALSHLDRSGILCGADEDGQALADRLRAFRSNVGKMEKELSETGRYDCEGLVVSKRERIGSDRFKDVAERTRQLYDFSIDWVPGFYINPSFGMLFGGCAFCQYPDFFTLFIIRQSFRKSSRWLIYDREELLSHELCHVARVGIGSEVFEESFAYQTSGSAFRRMLGGMFYRQSDSFLFLGVAMLLLLVQVIRTYALSWLPIWPFWVLLVAVFGGLFLRQGLGNRTMGRARRRLEEVFGLEHGLHALFRCTDEEIRDLSRLGAGESMEAWVEGKCSVSLRWRIIRHRFAAEGEDKHVANG